MSNELQMTGAAVSEAITGDLWGAARPWLIPSVIVLALTYGIIRLIERFIPKGKSIPREIKAIIPILIAVVFQFAAHRFTDVQGAAILAGIGIAHGAILSSAYEIVIRRVKKKIHGE